MSNDPNDPYAGYGSGDPYGQPPGGAGGQPPGYGGQPPGEPYGTPPGRPTPPPPAGTDAIRGRVLPPAIFLIVVGALNLLSGLYLLLNAYSIQGNPAALQMVQKSFEDQPAENRAELEKEGWTPESLLRFFVNLFYSCGGISAVASILIILGGIRMMALKSFGLAVFAALLALLPCSSPCCLVSQIASIWAFVVLFNREVRAAFH